MEAKPGRSFKVRLTKDEWDEQVRGWHCSVLRVPGAIVRDIYSKGKPLSKDLYRVDRIDELIYWIPENDPDELIAVMFALTEALSTETETAKWKKLAIVLPVVATIISPLLVAAFNFYTKEKPQNVSNQNTNLSTPHSNSNSEANGGSKQDQKTEIGRWVIGLETIRESDGGVTAAKRELIDKAKVHGYENQSCLLQYDGVYKVIIYFSDPKAAAQNLEKAKAINHSVSEVKDLHQWCGELEQQAEDIYTCTKDINLD